MSRHEEERLAEVDRLLTLKTTKDGDLQDIVRLAADLCGVPTALITLVGKDAQHVQYKHCFNTTSTAREDAFCAHIVDSGKALVVPDARKDTRFESNPLVTGDPHIRFYAGVPLTTFDGLHLGGLCVIDSVPGELSEQQQHILNILASQVVQLLEYDASKAILKSLLENARSEEIKMSSFFQSLGCAHLILDKELKVLAYNKTVADFIALNYKVAMYVGQSLPEFITDQLLVIFVQSSKKALQGEIVRGERHIKYVNAEYWLDICYEPARNPEGEIIGVSYSAVDISERVQARQQREEKERMLHSIAFNQAHGLRRPVSSIKGILNMLRDDGTIQQSPYLTNMEERIEFIDERILQIMNHTRSGENPA